MFARSPWYRCAGRSRGRGVFHIIKVNLEIAAAAVGCEQAEAVKGGAFVLVAGFEREDDRLFAERDLDGSIAGIGGGIVEEFPGEGFLGDQHGALTAFDADV